MTGYGSYPKPTLTPWEVRIVDLVTDGARDQDIADELGASLRTVSTQIARIKSKVGAANRAHLVKILYGLGELSVSRP